MRTLSTEFGDCEVALTGYRMRITFPGEKIVVVIPDISDHDLIPEGHAAEMCGHDTAAAIEEGRAQAISDFDIATASTLDEWHNEHHAGVFRFCYEAPCLETRRTVDAG